MRPIVLATMFSLGLTASALAAPVRHGGEWQTIIDNGKPLIACFPKDESVDQNSVMRPLSMLSGANCKVNSFNTVGDVTSYSIQCNIGGSQMISSGTVTQIGPDSFAGKGHSHGGMIKMPNGQSMAIPDSDTVTVSRRLGACKPGDRQITH